MKSSMPLILMALALSLFAGAGCGGKKGDASLLPHSNYGGCQLTGRHYHNTHVFIGDQYEPSLSEWLKY